MSDQELSNLPSPRRIITFHEPSGECVAIDDTVPMTIVPGGPPLLSAKIFVQSDIPGDPTKTRQYAEQPNEGFFHKTGLTVFAIDFKPNSIGPVHFTNSFDYIIATHGTPHLITTDGQSWDLGPSDVIINVANIHQWGNKTNEWARILCVLGPSKPFKTAEGRTLKELHPDAYTPGD